MPGQRSAGARRARGSWRPRLAGIGVVLLLAAGGTTAYLVAIRPAAAVPRLRLPTRVIAVQTVGLVVSRPAAGGGRRVPQMLLDSPAGLAFGPVPQSALVAGNPEWTADQMAGGTYVFIYAPSGKCLGPAASRHPAQLALQRCNLGPGQRWRPVNPPVAIAGRSYHQFGNLSSGGCLSAEPAGQARAAAQLARCSPARPWRQLVSFWWGV